jgi:hypothetical protein
MTSLFAEATTDKSGVTVGPPLQSDAMEIDPLCSV